MEIIVGECIIGPKVLLFFFCDALLTYQFFVQLVCSNCLFLTIAIFTSPFHLTMEIGPMFLPAHLACIVIVEGNVGGSLRGDVKAGRFGRSRSRFQGTRISLNSNVAVKRPHISPKSSVNVFASIYSLHSCSPCCSASSLLLKIGSSMRLLHDRTEATDEGQFRPAPPFNEVSVKEKPGRYSSQCR
jgi:hypothetical protein